MTELVDKNSTHRIVAFFVNASGAGLTGLSPTLRIRRDSDGTYWDKDDDSFNAAPDDGTMTETDSTYAAGWYHYEFSVPNTFEEYSVQADGGASAANRYQAGRMIACVKADSVVGNKSEQAVATGVVTVYASDASTAMHTMTPSVDDADDPTKNILTPG